MKLFTEADIKGVFSIIYTNGPQDLLHSPLVWQEHGLQQTVSGYGAKLTTHDKISFCGKLYRIYCTIWSNNGSCWFMTKGRKIYVH